MREPLPRVEGGRLIADWITASLREVILGGYFYPGEKVDVRQIADEFDVSRTPVREALQRLEAEGFIVVRPHKGAYIASVSQQDIREVYEVRWLLESEVLRQVTPLIPDSVLDELEADLKEERARFDAGDTTQSFETDVRFHGTINACVENRLLKETLDMLANRIAMVRRFAQLQSGPHLREGLQEHQAVLGAVRERDAERAADLMRHHLRRSAERLQALTR